MDWPEPRALIGWGCSRIDLIYSVAMTHRFIIAALLAFCALFIPGKAVADAQDGAVLAPGYF